MSLDSTMTKVGQELWKQLSEVSGIVRISIHTLSDQDLRGLYYRAMEICERIEFEQRKRGRTPPRGGDDPIWMAIQDAGIELQSHEVLSHGQTVTRWTWAIPSAQLSQHIKAGSETRTQALFKLLMRLIEVFVDFNKEEQTALASDLATFQAWKAFKEQAGTWDMFAPPQHPDAPPEEEEGDGDDPTS